MGRVLNILKDEDPNASKYDFLPYMATHSRGSVGSLRASSYAERINSAANLILTKGNTLLAEEEINMCTALRMNRSFMEFMRKYHPDAAKQRFKMTVISEDFSSD
jgi:adenylosuccinate synthase